jgi:Superinfection immunity protein
MDYSIATIIISLVIYFLPAIVARARKHRNDLAIFMLNLLLGWTVLGWIGALIWACTANTDAERRGGLISGSPDRRPWSPRKGAGRDWRAIQTWSSGAPRDAVVIEGAEAHRRDLGYVPAITAALVFVATIFVAFFLLGSL